MWQPSRPAQSGRGLNPDGIHVGKISLQGRARTRDAGPAAEVKGEDIN